MNFTEINKAMGLVEGFALVAKCDRKTNSRGGAYLDLLLSDSSGEIPAKLWDYAPEKHGSYTVGELVKVRGTVSQYNGADQLRVERIRPAAEGDSVVPEDFVRHASYSGEFMYGRIYEKVSAFTDEDLKKLVLTMLRENREKLLLWPAAYRLHHAIRGGLLMHTLAIVRLCEGVCEVYPFVDKDLLLAGAVLHDIAKLSEFEVGNSGLATGYSVEGNLLGHLVVGAMMVRETAQKLGTPPKKALLLEHMLISHHGEPDFGAAKRPLFLEAELLAELDLMDARVYQIREAVAPLREGEFSGKLWALDDRRIFSHDLVPTDRDINLD